MEKIKASELLELLLLTSEKALFQEEERLNKHISANRDLLITTLQDTLNYFTYDQTIQLHRLISSCIDCTIANNFYNSEYYRFTIIREVLIILIHSQIIIDDLHMKNHDDYKKRSIENIA